MVGAGEDNLLDGQDENARISIAERVGERLSTSDIPPAERQAAEALARQLAADAIERVRTALSVAVATATTLPRDIALKIAHDVDSVACPFLEITEVFSEADWEQLILTISRGAAVAIARRAKMPESLALTLARFGDSIVAEAFVENEAAPMTRPVCDTLIERFESATWVLDKLAQRDDLLVEIAARLTTMVSARAREKLERQYSLSEEAGRIASRAEKEAILQLARETPVLHLPALVRQLNQERRLSHGVLLKALREDMLEFFAAALAETTRTPLRTVKPLILRGAAGDVLALFRKARLPAGRLDDYWTALTDTRERRSGAT